jgi:RimJ/RimL family protein N-acetyltransferase
MLPTTIRTDRLLLRCWRPEDAPMMKAAVDSSLAHLKASVAWARSEPTPLSGLAERLAAFATAFYAGEEWVYALMDLSESQILGGIAAERAEPALVALVGADAVELGYWLRADATGSGYATEATAALAQAAFAYLGARRVVVCHDPVNEASSAVPRRLGFQCLGIVPNTVLPGRQVADGSVRPATTVWTLDAG